MLNFNDYEEIGRSKFNKVYLANYPEAKIFFIKNPMSIYDALIFQDNVLYITEIKNRDYKYINYSDMLLEWDKYQNLLLEKIQLQKKIDKYEIKILYVHTYNNSEQIKYSILDENYTIDDFKQEYQQCSQVLNNGKKLKYLKYITENIIKNK